MYLAAQYALGKKSVYLRLRARRFTDPLRYIVAVDSHEKTKKQTRIVRENLATPCLLRFQNRRLHISRGTTTSPPLRGDWMHRVTVRYICFSSLAAFALQDKQCLSSAYTLIAPLIHVNDRGHQIARVA